MRKIALKEQWPPSYIWVLFINESTHECEYFMLHPESNINGIDKKFTHWIKEN